MNKTEMRLKQINDLKELSDQELGTAADTYRQAFARAPYLELFTLDDSLCALQFILDKDGDLLLGQENNTVVSLAGGYLNEENNYFIEELAVRPDKQGQGIGRDTLEALIDLGIKRGPKALEIRTTASNNKAISLYESEGFALSNAREVVAKLRQNGKIELDERVYLTKQIQEDFMQKEKTKLRRVAIAYPSGNTTAVIFDQLKYSNPLSNDQIIKAWENIANGLPGVEQCCYVTLPKNKQAVARVEMFGGEFCGNATRSVIQLITGGQDYRGLIEVSGVDRPLNFSVRSGVITLEMPLPKKGNLATVVEEGILVQLDGIAQLVVANQAQKNRTPREILQSLLTQNKYGLAGQAAFGVTFYDPESKKAQFCVWVGGGTDETIFDETACGSGTCAIGVAASIASNANKSLEVIQPSGERITTQAQIDRGKVESSYISGTVQILYDGELSYGG